MPLTTEQLAEFTGNFLWYVEVWPKNGKALQGTAVQIRMKPPEGKEFKNYLLTCRHVVYEFDEATNRLVPGELEIRCWSNNETYDPEYSYIAEVIATRRLEADSDDEIPTAENDWVVLQIKDTPEKEKRFGTNNKMPEIADVSLEDDAEFTVLGYAAGSEKFDPKDTSQISQRTHYTAVEGLKLDNNALGNWSLRLTGNLTAEGMSGGPVLNEGGALVAIHRAYYAKCICKESTQLKPLIRSLREAGFEISYPEAGPAPTVVRNGASERDVAANTQLHLNNLGLRDRVLNPKLPQFGVKRQRIMFFVACLIFALVVLAAVQETRLRNAIRTIDIASSTVAEIEVVKNRLASVWGNPLGFFYGGKRKASLAKQITAIERNAYRADDWTKLKEILTQLRSPDLHTKQYCNTSIAKECKLSFTPELGLRNEADSDIYLQTYSASNGPKDAWREKLVVVRVDYDLSDWLKLGSSEANSISILLSHPSIPNGKMPYYELLLSRVPNSLNLCNVSIARRQGDQSTPLIVERVTVSSTAGNLVQIRMERYLSLLTVSLSQTNNPPSCGSFERAVFDPDPIPGGGNPQVTLSKPEQERILHLEVGQLEADLADQDHRLMDLEFQRVDYATNGNTERLERLLLQYEGELERRTENADLLSASERCHWLFKIGWCKKRLKEKSYVSDLMEVANDEEASSLHRLASIAELLEGNDVERSPDLLELAAGIGIGEGSDYQVPLFVWRKIFDPFLERGRFNEQFRMENSSYLQNLAVLALNMPATERLEYLPVFYLAACRRLRNEEDQLAFQLQEPAIERLEEVLLDGCMSSIDRSCTKTIRLHRRVAQIYEVDDVKDRLRRLRAILRDKEEELNALEIALLELNVIQANWHPKDPSVDQKLRDLGVGLDRFISEQEIERTILDSSLMHAHAIRGLIHDLAGKPNLADEEYKNALNILASESKSRIAVYVNLDMYFQDHLALMLKAFLGVEISADDAVRYPSETPAFKGLLKLYETNEEHLTTAFRVVYKRPSPSTFAQNKSCDLMLGQFDYRQPSVLIPMVARWAHLEMEEPAEISTDDIEKAATALIIEYMVLRGVDREDTDREKTKMFKNFRELWGKKNYRYEVQDARGIIESYFPEETELVHLLESIFLHRQRQFRDREE
ncbi:MAG: hypothetical protein Aurels2KO_39500 [Aureliella sp.]